MGYNLLETELENKLERSLRKILQQENSASTSQMVNIIENSRCRTISPDDEILYWMNEENETMSMSFAAILDLEGDYVRSRMNITIINGEPVSILSHFFFINLITNIKEQSFKAFFHLFPLSNAYKYNIPNEAIDSSMSAIDILQSMYQNAELRVQECHQQIREITVM